MEGISKKNFGKYIKRIREEKGISREELAKKIFVSYEALAKWEAGRRIPDFGTIGILADALGVSVQDIYDNSRSEGKEKIAGKVVSVLLIFVIIGGCVLGLLHNGKNRSDPAVNTTSVDDENVETNIEQESLAETTEENDNLVNDTRIHVAGKSYVSSNEDLSESGELRISFDNRGNFTYFKNAFSSYLGYGSYAEEDGYVIITDRDRDDDGNIRTNKFKIENDCLVWYEEGSSGFPTSGLSDGTIFNIDDKYISYDVDAKKVVPPRYMSDKLLNFMGLVPEYFTIHLAKGIEIYVYKQADKYYAVPTAGTNRVKGFGEILSSTPLTIDDVALIMTTYTDVSRGDIFVLPLRVENVNCMLNENEWANIKEEFSKAYDKYMTQWAVREANNDINPPADWMLGYSGMSPSYFIDNSRNHFRTYFNYYTKSHLEITELERLTISYDKTLAKKPFEDLKVENIESVFGQIFYQNAAVRVDDIKEIVEMLNDVVTYEEDNSYSEECMEGTYTLKLKDGKETVINIVAPFIFIDGIGYKAELEVCDKLIYYLGWLYKL